METYIGTIMGFAFNYEPEGWFFCDGRLLSINEYGSLYSLLGNRYGGDGRTTFGLPDLRGRVPMGFGQGPGLTNRALGTTLGEESVELTLENMPKHGHPGNVTGLTAKLKCAEGTGNTDSPVGHSLATLDRVLLFSDADPTEEMKTNSLEINGGNMTVDDAGSGRAHNNIQPSAVVNYCIAYEGVYPPRKK